MSIVYPLTPPTAFAAAKMATVSLARRVGISRSPFTGEQKVYEWPNEYWTASVSTPPCFRESGGAELEAFVASLHGAAGTFLWSPPYARTRRGTSNTTGVTVNGAGQTGRLLNVTGLGNIKTLLSGSFISLGTGLSTRLYQVVEDATSNATGDATLTIEPALRSTPANGAAVTLASPQGLWRLAGSSSIPQPTINGGGGSGNLYEAFNFSLEEAI